MPSPITRLIKVCPRWVTNVISPLPYRLGKEQTWGTSHRPICHLVAQGRQPAFPMSSHSFLALLQVDVTTQASQGYMFVWPTSLLPHTKWHIVQLVCQVINSANPWQQPASLDLRQEGVSFNYLCRYFKDHTRRAGQWSSSLSFHTHYLSHHLHNVPHNAMGVPSSLISSFLLLSLLLMLPTVWKEFAIPLRGTGMLSCFTRRIVLGTICCFVPVSALLLMSVLSTLLNFINLRLNLSYFNTLMPYYWDLPIIHTTGNISHVLMSMLHLWLFLLP